MGKFVYGIRTSKTSFGPNKWLQTKKEAEKCALKFDGQVWKLRKSELKKYPFKIKKLNKC
ncbi:MAG: hypothetical protein AABY22_12190 [Nanoarchaeota archaeon]